MERKEVVDHKGGARKRRNRLDGHKGKQVADSHKQPQEEQIEDGE